MKTIHKLIKAIGVTVSSDESLALLYYNSAVLYNTKDFSESWNFKIPSYTTSAVISNNNSMIAIKNVTGKISIWDINSQSLLKNFHMKRIEGSNCLFTPDDRYVVDADKNGNVMLIDIVNLSFKVIKTYEYCMINGICYNKETNEFIFTFNGKIQIENDRKFVIVCKYPFDENEPIKHVLSEEVGHFAEVKNIPNTEEFFSYNDNGLIVLNKNFDLNAKAKIKLDYVFKPVVCSQNGEYLATIKHGANLYSLKGVTIISNCFVKGATDISFFKDSKNLIVAARNGSYVLEI